MVAHCIDSLLERNPGVDPNEVDDCIVGSAGQTGEQGGNIARLSVALSKLPLTVPGATISREGHRARTSDVPRLVAANTGR